MPDELGDVLRAAAAEAGADIVYERVTVRGSAYRDPFTDVPVYTPLGFAEMPIDITIASPLKDRRAGARVTVLVTAKSVIPKTKDPADPVDLPHRKFSERTIVVYVVDTDDPQESIVDMQFFTWDNSQTEPHDHEFEVETPMSDNFRVQAFNLQIGNWKCKVQGENDATSKFKPVHITHVKPHP